jgi:AcrR family transcriptional regulator
MPAVSNSLAESDLEPRWRRRKDARPQEILSAALDLFIERGYAATRADDVAAQAGVSKGTVYLYFENKEELFKAVVRESYAPVLQEAVELLDQYEGSNFDLLDEILHGWWEKIGSTKAGGITKLMMAEAANFPEIAKFYYEEVIARSQQLITGVLQRGIARGEFRKLNVQDAMNVVIAPVLMLIIWNNSFGRRASACQPVDPQAHLKMTLDILKRGLAADPAALHAKPAKPANAKMHVSGR